jgi:hypothetical protein
VIGGTIWPMLILNKHLTCARFIGAYNLSYLRRLARTCFRARGSSGGGWWLCVLHVRNETEFPVEMIIHSSELKNATSDYFGGRRIARKIKLSTRRIMKVVSSIRSQT